MSKRKDLLDTPSLSKEEVAQLLEAAQFFKKEKLKTAPLKGKTVVTLFYESSTRTRFSFEVAAKRLGAPVVHFSISQSSISKGETLLDTMETLQGIQPFDYLIVRHQASGVPHWIAKRTAASVVNAGDGFHAHPTQALLDAFTLKEVFADLRGKKVLMLGDILYSRVARSTSGLLSQLGMKIAFLGPGTLVPKGLAKEHLHFQSFEEALRWKPDALYLLRLQLERQQEKFFPSISEYHRFYGVTQERFREIQQRGFWILHPGPVNRGVELVDEVMAYERSLIKRQVENSVPTRMAVLSWLRPGGAENV